jgi:hypothetical protein
MKKKEKILLSLCMTFVCYTYGQLPPPPPPPPPNLPVDGGLFFLIALAIIYGVKKTRN